MIIQKLARAGAHPRPPLGASGASCVNLYGFGNRDWFKVNCATA